MATPKKDRLYDVEISGLKLRLKSSHDEDFVNKVVELVNSKVKEALPLTKSDSVQTAALLACLNMAEEQLLLKQQLVRELDAVESRAEEILTQFHSTYVTRLSIDH